MPKTSNLYQYQAGIYQVVIYPIKYPIQNPLCFVIPRAYISHRYAKLKQKRRCEVMVKEKLG